MLQRLRGAVYLLHIISLSYAKHDVHPFVFVGSPVRLGVSAECHANIARAVAFKGLMAHAGAVIVRARIVKRSGGVVLLSFVRLRAAVIVVTVV